MLKENGQGGLPTRVGLPRETAAEMAPVGTGCWEARVHWPQGKGSSWDLAG